MQLVNVMLGFLEAVADEDALAVVVYLEHVELGFLAGPGKNFLKNVSDKIHGIDGIIPTNNEVTSFMSFAGFFFRPF